MGWLWVARVAEVGTVRRADSEKEREQRLNERSEMVEGDARVFWKMVYGKNFRKPFSLFSLMIFQSKSNVFC
jgi:hypothetical protein